MSLCDVEVKDLHDVGMPQCRNHLGLTLEARLQLRLCFNVAVHHFHSDKTIQSQVLPEIDLRHAPPPEFLVNVYISNCLANPLWHKRIIQHEFRVTLFEMLRNIP